MYLIIMCTGTHVSVRHRGQTFCSFNFGLHYMIVLRRIQVFVRIRVHTCSVSPSGLNEVLTAHDDKQQSGRPGAPHAPHPMPHAPRPAS